MKSMREIKTYIVGSILIMNVDNELTEDFTEFFVRISLSISSSDTPKLSLAFS